MDTVARVRKISQLTVFALIFLSFIIKLFFEYHNYHSQLKETIEDRALHHKILLDNTIDEVVNGYIAKTNLLIKNPKFISYIKQRDRVNLYKFLENYYATFKKENPYLYVMHIVDINNKTILRMHKPESFDDDLTNIRPIMKKVNMKRETLHGFEVGKNGMTYRVTLPIIIKSNSSIEHLGVLEFGIKPIYFLDRLKNIFDLKGAVLTKNEMMKELSYNVDYPKFKDYSLSYHDKFFDNYINDIVNKDYIEVEDKIYLLCKKLNLKNIDGQIVSKFILADDITELKEHFLSNVLASTVDSIIVLSIILIVLHFTLGFYTKKILDYTNQLQNVNIALEKKVKLRTKELEELSITDDLTKIYNRRYFNKIFTKELSRAIRDKNSLICIMFDIDYFKLYNDTYGHLRGDDVLIRVVNGVKNSLKRPNDFLFRVGGEEFCIITSNMEKENVLEYVNTLKDTIENLKIIHEKNSASKYVTASFGIAYIKNVKNHMYEEKIYSTADEALYKAKSSGRNKVEILEINE